MSSILRRTTAARACCHAALGIAVAASVVLQPFAARAEQPSPLVALPAAAVLPAMVQQPVSVPHILRAELSPEVQQSLGCALTGTVGTVGAIVAGGENLVNIIAGGVVMPQNRAVLYIGLVGVVFASFCAIGQALTPLYLYAVSTPEPDAPEAAMRSGTSVPRISPGGPLLRTAGSAHGPLATLLVAPR